MNRIAIVLLILLVTALAILLAYRTETGSSSDHAAVDVRRQPAAALEDVRTLLQRVQDGATAARQSRELLNTIIESGISADSTLDARRCLAELEQLLGNDTAAADALLDAIQAHPGHETTPDLLFGLGLLLAGPLDRPGEAGEMFTRVVNLYPAHDLAPEAAIRLARIRIQTDTCSRAAQLSDLHDLLRTNPGHPLADEARLLVDQFPTEHAEHE